MSSKEFAQKYKVLVVDDEKAIADAFVEILAHAGYLPGPSIVRRPR